MTNGVDLQVVSLILGAASLLVSLLVLRKLAGLNRPAQDGKPVTASVASVPTPAVQPTDDRQLVAVLTAAIEAYRSAEADNRVGMQAGSPAGFVIRKIRRV